MASLFPKRTLSMRGPGSTKGCSKRQKLDSFITALYALCENYSHCDLGYLMYGDFCYHFETEFSLNWPDAEEQCKGQGGQLVSFHSQEELSFLTAHMPGEAWVGLNDRQTEGTFVYSDGTPFDLVLWAPNQPDDWNDSEDCVQLRGMNHHEPGKLNDDVCTSAKEYICKKRWNDKCGFWTAAPFNDYCYLFNYLSMRPWAEARADCLNQGGDLVSITHPIEQAFLQALVGLSPTGVSMWMGGHDSVTEGGWSWTDGEPFRYINWSPGNPDYYSEDCLSILINGGKWNDDKCEHHRGYICKRRAGPPSQLPAGVLQHVPGVVLHVAVLLGFSILTLVVLLRLIGWWRTRGNKMATEESIGRNSASDAPPVGERLGPGAADQYIPSPSLRMYQHYTADIDVDRAPRGPLVGSAQDRVDPGELSDAAAYENLRVPPGCVEDPRTDTGVHFVTVHQLPG